MRAAVVVILSLVVGVALGSGMTWARYGGESSASAIKLHADPAPLPLPSAGAGIAGSPKVAVEETEHDFGPVESDSIVSHEFHFTNSGDAPLKLEAGGTTCQKCTIAEITKGELPPGASIPVTIRYTAGSATPQFRQSATILTNDPERPRVELTVSGSVTSILDVQPSQLVFSNLSVHEERTLEAKLVNHLTNSLSITDYELSDPSTRNHIDVQFRPMDAQALAEAEGKSGQVVAVTIRPGLPLGQYRQKLILTTDLPGQRKVEIEVAATISSDISLVGGGWDEEHGFVHIGPVNSQDGAKRNVLVLVRGPHRNDVQIKVGEVWPTFLRVTLGEKGSIGDGAVVKYPLSIEIPPGSPSANHLGSSVGKIARITLETTHPDATQVKVPVRFAVEE
jgi:hypothetical protein